MDNVLKKHGFYKADDNVYPRLIVSDDGHESTGKTNFALSAPGDIAFFNSDTGIEGVIHKFSREKDIYPYDFCVPAIQEEAKKELKNFTSAWKDIWASNSIRTIVVDTATDLWALFRITEFGRSSNVAHLYTPLNAKFRRFLNVAYEHKDKNLLLIHKLKKQYKNDAFTGDWERSGFNEIGHYAQIVLKSYRDADDFTFHKQVYKCRQNPELNGMDLEGDMLDFATVAQMVLPETDEEDWI
jgi:hypothetical protein